MAKEARDKLALPNTLNLLFGKSLLTRATLSCRALNGDLLEPLRAANGDALRLLFPLSVLKINVRLNRVVLEHTIM